MMKKMDVGAPQLIEESAKIYFDELLQRSHSARMRQHYTTLNILVVVFFVVIIGSFLYYRYVNKPSRAESQHRIMSDQEFVLSKIRYFKEENQRIHAMSSPITNLPLPGVHAYDTHS